MNHHQPHLTALQLRVLRDIRGNGGVYLHTEPQRRAMGALVLAGYARRLKNGHKITRAGNKLLNESEPPNPYGDIGAW